MQSTIRLEDVPNLILEIQRQLHVIEGKIDLKQDVDNRPLTIEQAAEYAQCAVTTLRKAIYRSELEYSRRAGRLYFTKANLDKWLLG